MRIYAYIITLLSILSFNTSAFTLNNSAGAVFEKDEVYVNVDGDGCENTGLTNSELLNLVGEAVNKYWNTVPTSKLSLKKGKLVTLSSSYRTDAIESLSPPNSDITIACNISSDNFGSTSVLGVTLPTISGTKITGAIFLINNINGTIFKDLSTDKQVSVIAHELGHAIGLGHTAVSHALMYYKSMENTDSLNWDDIDGVTYLYPKKQPVNTCGTISEESGPGNNFISLILGALLALAIILTANKTLKKYL